MNIKQKKEMYNFFEEMEKKQEAKRRKFRHLNKQRQERNQLKIESSSN